MAEYIERERILALINGEERPSGDGVYGYYSRIFDIIDTASAADVAPIKHGEWVYGEYDVPHCSECGTEVRDISPYCPHCGACMDDADDE